jgi:LytS/YehU family sensor histidine kinase
LKIRFENAVQLKINVKKELGEEVLVPPISLQVLIENAVKHNEFSDNDPLLIIIDCNETELIVYNKIHKKTLRKTSSKIGLQNLNDRYQLTTKRSIEIKEGEDKFTVILPLLKID